MIAVRDKGGALDLAAYPDAENRNRLVANEADDARDGDRQQELDFLRVHQVVNALVKSHEGAEQNDRHDGDARKILDAPEAVGKPGRGLRRTSWNAIQSGIAVTASPTLWMVSASNATLPEAKTTTSCKAAVIARITKDHLMAQMPFSVVARLDRSRRAYGRAYRHARDHGRGRSHDRERCFQVGKNRARQERSGAYFSYKYFVIVLNSSIGARASDWRDNSGFQTVIKMIVDKRLLRFADGAFNCVKLLRQINTGAALLDHPDDAVQMPFRAAQALEDVRVRVVGLVGHGRILSPLRG